jgi:hypothetical protein
MVKTSGVTSGVASGTNLWHLVHILLRVWHLCDKPEPIVQQYIDSHMICPQIIDLFLEDCGPELFADELHDIQLVFESLPLFGRSEQRHQWVNTWSHIQSDNGLTSPQIYSQCCIRCALSERHTTPATHPHNHSNGHKVSPIGHTLESLSLFCANSSTLSMWSKSKSMSSIIATTYRKSCCNWIDSQ